MDTPRENKQGLFIFKLQTQLLVYIYQLLTVLLWGMATYLSHKSMLSAMNAKYFGVGFG